MCNGLRSNSKCFNMNTKSFALLLVSFAAVQFCAARELVHSYKITNKTRISRPDAPVVITIPETEAWVRSATVYQGDTEIPSQLDDLTGDGKFDELSLVIDLAAWQSRSIRVLFTDVATEEERYPARVHARMFLVKEDKTREARQEISAEADNMYSKVYPHGPAFESELVAYRIYFDKRQTADLYGKQNKGLELAGTGWYPTAKQLAEGYGDDIIRVFNSVGVGTLKGWDPVKKQVTHITPMTRRTARIVANGPVRTVVDMAVEGWQYQNRTLDITSRYILYAGHRDAEVCNTITGGEGLTFCTGVMKIAEHTKRIEPAKGFLATWGTDYPFDDTVKFGKQTVGLAVGIDPKRIKESVENAENYLIMMTPDNRGRIDYRMTFAAEKENFGYKSDTDFYSYVTLWALERQITVKQTR